MVKFAQVYIVAFQFVLVCIVVDAQDQRSINPEWWNHRKSPDTDDFVWPMKMCKVPGLNPSTYRQKFGENNAHNTLARQRESVHMVDAAQMCGAGGDEPCRA